MPDLSPGAKRFLPWFNIITGATYAGLSTADIYSALANAQMAEAGVVTLPSASALSELRHVALLQREATRSLTAAEDSDALTGGMIAPNVVQRNTLQQSTNPKFIVRFEHQFTIDGEPAMTWRASQFEGDLPLTVGNLTDLLDRDAERLSEDYGVEHVGIGAISILQV